MKIFWFIFEWRLVFFNIFFLDDRLIEVRSHTAGGCFDNLFTGLQSEGTVLGVSF